MFPASRQSRDEAPILTKNLPVTAVQSCLFSLHIMKSRSTRSKVMRWCSPGFSICVLLKPRSCHGGSPAIEGKLRYNCDTSRPGTLPVFWTEHETSSPCASTMMSLYSNDVYESPVCACCVRAWLRIQVVEENACMRTPHQQPHALARYTWRNKSHGCRVLVYLHKTMMTLQSVSITVSKWILGREPLRVVVPVPYE